MKPIAEWIAERDALPSDAALSIEHGAAGLPTVKAGDIYLHSRYRPVEEAGRLVQNAGLEKDRPVLVIGAGLGYHVRALEAAGFEAAVIEPNPAMARLALGGPLGETSALLAVGAPEDWEDSPAFRRLAARNPQLFVHPPTARLHPGFADEARRRLAQAELMDRPLSVAVVGPMFGGSLPIAGYLSKAFRELGHRTLFVDTSLAWPLYNKMRTGLRSQGIGDRLGVMQTNVLNEWCYAQVAEFQANVCVVLAQAPVTQQFPGRLRQHGTVTAFWFVENWRHLDYWRHVAPAYDCFFHIQPGAFEEQLAGIGCKHHASIPTACDPGVHRPVELNAEERTQYGADVAFAGASYLNRKHLLQGLTDYNLAIWGPDWDEPALTPHLRAPGERFDADTFNRIAAGARVNVNLHASQARTGVDPESDAINPRVFELAACGAFQLCDPAPGLDALFDTNQEIPTYGDLPELRRLIDYYLSHDGERHAVAKRARERALGEHTYHHRAKAMLSFIAGRFGEKMLAAGVREQITVSAMAQRVQDDPALHKFLQTLPPDTPFLLPDIAAALPPANEGMEESEAIFRFLAAFKSSTDDLLAARR